MSDFIAAISEARVRRLEPFGVEIDFDLSRPFDAREAKAFRDLFFRENWLLFRNQQLTMDEQIRLIELLGTVIPGFGAGYLYPEDKVIGSIPLDYHSDMSATPMPLDVLSLLAIDLDETAGTWTGFVSGKRALNQMPDALRKQVADLEVTFLQTPADKSQLTDEIPDDRYRLVRPAVINHRITGEPLLYTIESATALVPDMSRAESREMLDRIFSYIYAPTNELRHVWKQGDFLIWDNIFLQHCRPPLDERYRRRMQRVGAGRKTLREQIPDYGFGAFFGED